jgi:predicted amidohydrolase YtcJ
VTRVALRHVEVDGEVVDVRVDDGRITAVGTSARTDAEIVIDGEGGALVPGLWDHHVHLLSMAAARRSVHLGPPEVTSADDLASALREADVELSPGTWLRGVGYHESVAGDIDRQALDRVVADRPVRVQHRSGAQWVLNSDAVRRLGLDREGVDHPGVERDAAGHATGRLFGADDLVRGGLAIPDEPGLAEIGARLARLGVIGVTDATPTTSTDTFGVLADAVRHRDLPVRVMVTGSPAIDPTAIPVELEQGPAKVIVADHDLPSLASLVDALRLARSHDRAVALHCVTLEALLLSLAALDEVGTRDGDRIEHGAVVPPDLAGRLAERGLIVVTQPNFVAERGDEYRAEVDRRDLPHLYPCASLLDAGVRVAGSTDAPFGGDDPWRAIAAAVDRRTRSGAVLGATERLSPARALALFQTDGSAPGGRLRQVATGAPADLCLLDAPLSVVLQAPSADHVAATIAAGIVTHRRADREP